MLKQDPFPIKLFLLQTKPDDKKCSMETGQFTFERFSDMVT
uniref:Uncharacterized protein n=1 Tax=Anguilla anguilla TaxID=7936 RepID=A0A0E9W5C2_ANGAN